MFRSYNNLNDEIHQIEKLKNNCSEIMIKFKLLKIKSYHKYHNQSLKIIHQS